MRTSLNRFPAAGLSVLAIALSTSCSALTLAVPVAEHGDARRLEGVGISGVGEGGRAFSFDVVGVR